METPHIHEHAYYYDFHPTEEDSMGETGLHSRLIRYLMEVLTWLMWGERCALHENLNFYDAPEKQLTPIAPDIALIKGVDFEPVSSWELGQTGPAPQMVIEIASEETWSKDLTLKPLKYAQMGVEEYFAYDPNEPPLNRRRPRRLYGWRGDPARATPLELPRGLDGRLWSEQLQSWLVPDGAYLRLYDAQGHLRLTRAEAEARARVQETEAKQAALRQVEEEVRAKQAALQRAEALAEKLRSLGIDPDQV